MYKNVEIMQTEGGFEPNTSWKNSTEFHMIHKNKIDSVCLEKEHISIKWLWFEWNIIKLHDFD